MNQVEFQMWTAYHPPVGFSDRGHNEFYWQSKCGRWSVRQGNRNTMILTDNPKGIKHVIAGAMPEVQAFIREQGANP